MFEDIEDKKSKKSVVLAIFSVLVLLIAVFGVSFAIWNWQHLSATANTLKSANIAMSLLESKDAIDIRNATPITDEEGMKLGEGKKFDFAVTTSMKDEGSIHYDISITKLSVSDGYTVLPDNEVKVYLTVLEDSSEVKVMEPTLVSDIITEGETGMMNFDEQYSDYFTHKHGDTDESVTSKYRLRMWIDSSVDASSWTDSTKYEYKLKVNVQGSLVE